MRISSFLTALALSVSFAGVSLAQTGELEMTNAGGLRPNVFTGNVLTPPPAPGSKAAAAIRILYAPSEADDPAFRAAIAAAAGGATVDYFDARAATPDAALLLTYDAVHVWVNFGFFDNVAYGNNLAAFNDIGGDVVLGAFCTYTAGNSLSGAIMTAAYSPVVSPLGSNHFGPSPYIGDGTTCIYAGVLTLDISFRDVLALQGTGVADGSYFDGEICHAFRPTTGGASGNVVYSNGSGASVLGGTGDWAIAVANAITCIPSGSSGSCTFRQGLLGLNPAGYDCVNVPSAGALWNSTIDTNPLLGTSTLQTIIATSLTGSTNSLPLFGFEMLALPPFLLDASLGAHSIPVPLGVTGLSLATQGIRVETDSLGNVFIVLMNAQDIVIG